MADANIVSGLSRAEIVRVSLNREMQVNDRGIRDECRTSRRRMPGPVSLRPLCPNACALLPGQDYYCAS